MRYMLVALCLTLSSVTPAMAAVDIHLGINLGAYPRLVPVPGYPVYYAPGVNNNYFFYDGLYWVFDGDDWYASSWYNGPWRVVDPYAVPIYILQVPVRYYRHAPLYFRGWRADAAPRWHEHYGRDWEQRRSGWSDRRRERAQAAPLPTYQRQYSGNRYPQAEQQPVLHGQNYRYQPRETVVQQHYQQQGVPQRAQVEQRGQQGEQRGPGRGQDQRDGQGRGHDRER
jgi:hypothetical protein